MALYRAVSVLVSVLAATSVSAQTTAPDSGAWQPGIYCALATGGVQFGYHWANHDAPRDEPTSTFAAWRYGVLECLVFVTPRLAFGTVLARQVEDTRQVLVHSWIFGDHYVPKAIYGYGLPNVTAGWLLSSSRRSLQLVTAGIGLQQSPGGVCADVGYTLVPFAPVPFELFVRAGGALAGSLTSGEAPDRSFFVAAGARVGLGWWWMSRVPAAGDTLAPAGPRQPRLYLGAFSGGAQLGAFYHEGGGIRPYALDVHLLEIRTVTPPGFVVAARLMDLNVNDELSWGAVGSAGFGWLVHQDRRSFSYAMLVLGYPPDVGAEFVHVPFAPRPFELRARAGISFGQGAWIGTSGTVLHASVGARVGFGKWWMQAAEGGGE